MALRCFRSTCNLATKLHKDILSKAILLAGKPLEIEDVDSACDHGLNQTTSKQSLSLYLRVLALHALQHVDLKMLPRTTRCTRNLQKVDYVYRTTSTQSWEELYNLAQLYKYQSYSYDANNSECKHPFYS